MPKKFFLGLAAIVAACSLAACSTADEAATDDGASTTQEQPAAAQPELDNIPDVVAVVNDQKITGDTFAESYKAQFQQLSMQAQMSGTEPNQDAMKKQAADMMVNSELLVMEADEQGFTAADEDVEAYLATMAEAQGLDSADALLSEFEAQGLSADRVRQDIQREVLIEQVIETLEVEAPSEDELRSMYDTQVEQLEAMNAQMDADQAQDVPSFDELKPQLTQQATAQQENAALAELIDELRSTADIEILL